MKAVAFLFFCYLQRTTADNSCDGSFKIFLDCIAQSTGDENEGKQLEIEFDNDFVTLCGRCFDPSETGSNSQCILSRQELETNITSDDGPLRGCSMCQKVAVTIRDKFFKSDERVRTCLRQEFSSAIANELQPCIQAQLKEYTFQIPSLPDFDKSTRYYLDIVERGVSHRVMAYNRLFVCQQRDTVRAESTRSCLRNPVGLYTQHCNLVQSCRAQTVPNVCYSRFDNVKSATCTCFSLKRNEWHEKLIKIRVAVFDSDSPALCSSGIKSAIGDWRLILENAMKKCLSDDDVVRRFSLEKLIDLGCARALAVSRSDDGKKQLATGFRMVRNLLDALNDRITNFCEATC